MKNKESKKYEIGNRIRKYREASHLSQKQLAEILGVSNSRVSNWEQGLNRPDADILAEMCVALDVSPSLLLGIKVTGDELTEQLEKKFRYSCSGRYKAGASTAINAGPKVVGVLVKGAKKR